MLIEKMFMLKLFHLMEKIIIKYIAKFRKNETATMFFLKKPSLVNSVPLINSVLVISVMCKREIIL